MQKRLLLSNLSEIYSNFKEENPDLKIGFSTFASLRPQWCILAGPKGKHSVCVCTHHQNVKLMVAAISSQLNYKDLMSMIVCDVNNKDCMLHHCGECPNINVLKTFIREQLKENTIQQTTEIRFKQWQSTDRSTLEDEELDFDDFVEKLAEKYVKLTEHHFIADYQSHFFKGKKEKSILMKQLLV